MLGEGALAKRVIRLRAVIAGAAIVVPCCDDLVAAEGLPSGGRVGVGEYRGERARGCALSAVCEQALDVLGVRE